MYVRVWKKSLLSIFVTVLLLASLRGGVDTGRVDIVGTPGVAMRGGHSSVGGEGSAPSVISGVPAIEGGVWRAGMTDGWFGKVTTQIEREEYNASVAERGLQAPNRAHNFRTYFQNGGIEVVPRKSQGAQEWRFRWRTTRWGREGRLTDVKGLSYEPRANGSHVSYVHEGLEEWYENKQAGLEQGFRVWERPKGDGALCIEGRIGGELRAELRSNEGAIDFINGDGARVLRYTDLHVRDASGGEVPSYLRLHENRVAILIEDAGAAYPLTVDPLVTSPSWTAESDQAAARLGISVGTTGDVNGDGYSDVIVGAWGYDNGQTDEGRALVYYGSAAGLTMSPSWTVESDQAAARFGISVGTAGDVNGDGYSDVIVGADCYDNGQTDEGRAQVYHGSATGLALSAAWTAESNQATANFAWSVATAGDVNGDGFSDVIVGAYAYDGGQTDEGQACVFHGSAGGLALDPAWTAESNQIGAQFGGWVATAEDVNGDGFSDIVVGAPGYDNSETDEGQAYVYHGSTGGLS